MRLLALIRNPRRKSTWMIAELNIAGFPLIEAHAEYKHRVLVKTRIKQFKNNEISLFAILEFLEVLPETEPGQAYAFGQLHYRLLAASFVEQFKSIELSGL